MVTATPTRPRSKQPPLPVVTVPRLAAGGVVVCVASGPSLTEDDVRFCEGKATVIAVNDAYKLAPWAACLYASDADWWERHRGVPSFTGLKYCVSRAAFGRWPDVQVLQLTGHEGVEMVPTGLRSGRNSGSAALNLAVHFGASRVLLLGYDCGVERGKPEHFFGAHKGLRNGSPYPLFRTAFAKMAAPLKAAGVSVVNCSRRTYLDVFPILSLREALA